MNKEEIEKDIEYFKKLSKIWKESKGNIEQKAGERLDNILEYIEQLEHDNNIMQRSLAMQTQGWNEGARLFAEKQRLIDKLVQDKVELTEELKYNITKIEARMQLNLVNKYLEILK